MSPRRFDWRVGPFVFGDVDGVLNTPGYFDRLDATTAYSLSLLDPVAIERLNRLFDATGAVLIVTSSHRIGAKLATIKDAFLAAGYRHRNIAGATRSLLAEDPRKGLRGREIQDWLDTHWDFTATGPGAPRFVILDDIDDMGPLRPHLIQTDPSTGLLDEHVERAVSALLRVT